MHILLLCKDKGNGVYPALSQVFFLLEYLKRGSILCPTIPLVIQISTSSPRSRPVNNHDFYLFYSQKDLAWVSQPVQQPSVFSLCTHCDYPTKLSTDWCCTKTLYSDLSTPISYTWTRKYILYSNPAFFAHLTLFYPSPFQPLYPTILPSSLIAKPSPSTTKPKLTKEVHMSINHFKNTNTMNDQDYTFV